VGTPYESHNLRRDFRRVTASAGLGARWVCKELRTSFVSIMSYQGVPVEEIARLAGHASSRTTEVVYRRELRPVITAGTEIMEDLPAEAAAWSSCRSCRMIGGRRPHPCRRESVPVYCRCGQRRDVSHCLLSPERFLSSLGSRLTWSCVGR
jgi:hypothetical protein